MTCPSCIMALAGTDGFDPPALNKTTAIGTAIGGVAGYLLLPKHRWVAAALGAAAGYFIAPKLAGSVSSSAPAPASAPSAALPPGGRPPVPPPAPVTSSQAVRIMPATTLQPPPEVSQQTETDAFLQEWMSPSEGPMQF